MASFPSMDKSSKEYEAELSKFSWSAAQSKAGVPFNSSALSKAKKLAEDAGKQKLEKPYAKIGVVKGDLVFRIKHGGSKHFGSGDIVLVPDFVTAAGSPELSKKDKNQGALQLSGERNAVSAKWWKETRGKEPDRTGLEPLLGKAATLLAQLERAPTRADLDALNDVLRRAGAAIGALRSDYPSVNDRRILDKLAAGLTAAGKDAQARNDAFEAKAGAALRELRQELIDLPPGILRQHDLGVRDVRRALKDGDLKKAVELYDRATGDLDQASARLAQPFLTRQVDFLCRKHGGVSPDAFPAAQVRQWAADALKKFDPARTELKALSAEIEALRARAADPTLSREIKRLEADAGRLQALAVELGKAIEYATGLAKEVTLNTRNGKNAWAWAAEADGAFKRLQGGVGVFVLDVLEAQRAATQDKGPAAKFVAELVRVSTRLSGQVRSADAFPGLKAMKQAVDSMPDVAVAHAKSAQGLLDAKKAIIAEVRKQAAALQPTDRGGGGAKALLAEIKRLEAALDETVRSGQIDAQYKAWPYLTGLVRDARFSKAKTVFESADKELQAIEAELAALKKKFG